MPKDRKPSITITGVTGYQVWEQAIFVDNGTGAAVTNLAGSKAFERQMHKLIFDQYKNDPKSVIHFFDKPFVMGGAAGAAATGVANALGNYVSPDGSLNHTNIGTQTVVGPVLDATGLLLDQDTTDAEGAHYSSAEDTIGDQEFVVGQEEFSVTARVVMADWTDAHFLVGFRRKAAYAADFNDYTDLAAIGGGAADGDSVTTHGILNDAATVATDTTVNFANAVSVLLEIKVAINGTVTALVDGVSYPIYNVGTTALVLDATDIMIPFFQNVNIGGGTPGASLSEFVAVNDTNWKG